MLAVPSSAGASGPPAGRDLTLKVLSFNIFYGGDDLDLGTGDFCAELDGCPRTLKVIERAIRASGADVVGLQETERNTEVIARRLGWYGSDRAHVLSRYPIVDPPDGDGVYVFVEPSPGRVVAVANVHLPSDPYGPYLVRDGGSRTDLLALERRTRLPAIQEQVRVLPRLAARGIPVVLTGDFNSPSHLDWTPAVAKSRVDVPFPVVWPVSKALADAGLRDSYREAHPDPVAVPGFTWTPGGPESNPQEVFDRIDWVLHAGPSRTVASTVVGEKGDPDAGVVVTPFPSDHRGVVSTLLVRPGTSPVLVSPADRRVTIGDPVSVTVRAPGRGTARVTLANQAGRILDSVPVRAGDSVISLNGRGLTKGENRIRLLSGDGRVLSRASVWAYPAGAATTLRTLKASYRVGEPITFGWENAPGMALDWVSAYTCASPSEPCGPATEYQAYVYTRTEIAGRSAIGPDPASGPDSWPLPVGSYILRLLPDDGYQAVAESARFTVVAS
jgi:hypothetical protein